jgi:hypothetical protein
MKIHRTTTLVALAALAALLTGCSSSDSPDEAPKPSATVTATPTVTSDPSPSAEPYADVVAYANDHGFPEVTASLADSTGMLCEAIQGRKRDGSWVRTYRKAFVESATGGVYTKEQADKLFNVLVDGCVKTGHTTLWTPPPPPPPPETSFDDGIWLVGEDIAAGTYRAEGDGCYWARLSGVSGELDDVIANGNPSGPAIVRIAKSDHAFESQRCGTWEKID